MGRAGQGRAVRRNTTATHNDRTQRDESCCITDARYVCVPVPVCVCSECGEAGLLYTSDGSKLAVVNPTAIHILDAYTQQKISTIVSGTAQSWQNASRD